MHENLKNSTVVSDYFIFRFVKDGAAGFTSR